MNDLSSGRFDPSVYCKQNFEDIQAYVRDHFSLIQTFYAELLARSPRYPKIDFETLYMCLHDQDKENILPRSFVEISFLKATTKFQSVRGIKGALNRGELLETLVRCAVQVNQNKLSVEQLDSFVTDLVSPIAYSSTILATRAKIRKYRSVNNFLHDNQEFLETLYTQFKLDGKFTQQSAINLFS